MAAASCMPPAEAISQKLWEAQSPFRKRVYRALCRVESGQVITYAALARAIGSRCPRAVGQALRHNPFAPCVPCHRVIASDLRIGGFSGARSGPDIDRKRFLLEREGIRFDGSGRLADRSQLAILKG